MKPLDKMSKEEILKVLYKEEKQLNKMTEDFRKLKNREFKKVRTSYSIEDYETGWFQHWLEY